MTSYTHTLTSTRPSGEGGRYYSNQVGASISCIASLAGFVLVNEIGPTSKGKVIEYKTLHLRNMPDVPVVAPADAGGGDDGDGEGNRGRTEARNDPNEPNKLLSPYKPEVYTPVISDSSGYASSEITWNRSAPNTVNTNATSQWYTNSSSRAPTFTEESKTDREQFSPDSGVVPGASISRSEPIPVFFGSGVGRGAEGQVYASSSSAVDSSLSTTVNTNAGIRSRSASDPASSQICTVASCSDQERVRSSSFPNPYTFSTDASSSTSLDLTSQASMPTTIQNWSITGRHSHKLNRDSGSSLCQLPNSISSSHGKQADSTSSLLSLQNYGIPSLDPPGFASQCSVSNYASIPNEQTPTIIDSEVQSGSDVSSFTPPLSTRPSRDLTTESSSRRRASVPQSTPYQNFQFGLYESNQGTDLNRLTDESRASTYVSSRSAMTMTLETEKATSVPYTQRNLNAYSSNSLNYLSNRVNIYPSGSDSAGPGPSTLAYHMSNLPSSRTLTEQILSSSQLGAQTTEPPSLTPAEALSNSPIAHASSKKASQTTPTAKTKDRKRNHPCWMCHKSFDRPSTLRKHLLVHTGEKAFVCNICGRRFSVASNLNRHTRRCSLRLTNAKPSSCVPESATPQPKAESSVSLSPPYPSSTSSSMAREKTNPDVRRAERERDGRQVQDGDPIPHPAPPEVSASQHRGRTRSRGLSNRSGQSTISADLGNSSSSTYPPSAASVRFRADSRPPSSHGRYPSNSAISTPTSSSPIAAASSSATTGEGSTFDLISNGGDRISSGEPRPKRRRRAPSPSRWVPASLQNYSLSPTRTRTAAPLPPVSPGYDAITGDYEERNSFSNGVDENEAPSELSDAEVYARRRNYELAPYHPCGWTGRLPGPAVILGGDITNYTKSNLDGGGYYDGGKRFEHPGTSSSLMFSFSLKT